LSSQLPSGRPVHANPAAWVVPKLSQDVWLGLKAQVSGQDHPRQHEERDQRHDADSSDDELHAGKVEQVVPGTYPASRAGYY